MRFELLWPLPLPGKSGELIRSTDTRVKSPDSRGLGIPYQRPTRRSQSSHAYCMAGHCGYRVHLPRAAPSRCAHGLLALLKHINRTVANVVKLGIVPVRDGARLHVCLQLHGATAPLRQLWRKGLDQQRVVFLVDDAHACNHPGLAAQRHSTRAALPERWHSPHTSTVPAGLPRGKGRLSLCRALKWDSTGD